MANTSVHPDHSGGESVTLRSSFGRSACLMPSCLPAKYWCGLRSGGGGEGGGAVPNATLTTTMIFA